MTTKEIAIVRIITSYGYTVGKSISSDGGHDWWTVTLESDPDQRIIALDPDQALDLWSSLPAVMFKLFNIKEEAHVET